MLLASYISGGNGKNSQMMT